MFHLALRRWWMIMGYWLIYGEISASRWSQMMRALGFRRARKKRHNAAPLSQRRMYAAFVMPGYVQRPGSPFHPRQLRDQSRAALPVK